MQQPPNHVAGLPDSVSMIVGEDRSFELPGLGTAGYIWQERVDGPPGVLQIGWTRGFPPDAPLPAVGISASETVTMRAVGSGDVSLVLAQRRPWEINVEPRSQHTVRVHVDPSPA